MRIDLPGTRSSAALPECDNTADVDKHNDTADSLFGARRAGSAGGARPPRWRRRPRAGHFDELRGGVSAPRRIRCDRRVEPHALPRRLGALLREPRPRRLRRPEPPHRQPASGRCATTASPTTSTPTPDGPQRPWSLDLFPLIITPESWQQIEAGVLQRVQLLDRIMADVYGPQELLAKNLLPPALVQGHPGYLRAMHGVQPAGGTHLHIAAFDMARDPDGDWWVVSQRTQAPSGLGYLLENRLIISRLFPEAFRDLQGAAAGRHLPRPGGRAARDVPGRRRARASCCSRPAPTTKPISSTPTWRATSA